MTPELIHLIDWIMAVLALVAAWLLYDIESTRRAKMTRKPRLVKLDHCYTCHKKTGWKRETPQHFWRCKQCGTPDITISGLAKMLEANK